jgi:hypothetical protein
MSKMKKKEFEWIAKFWHDLQLSLLGAMFAFYVLVGQKSFGFAFLAQNGHIP